MFSRIAHSALGQHTEAVGCYQKALELDPSNASYSQNLEIAEQKVQEQVMQCDVLSILNNHSSNENAYSCIPAELPWQMKSMSFLMPH